MRFFENFQFIFRYPLQVIQHISTKRSVSIKPHFQFLRLRLTKLFEGVDALHRKFTDEGNADTSKLSKSGRRVMPASRVETALKNHDANDTSGIFPMQEALPHTFSDANRTLKNVAFVLCQRQKMQSPFRVFLVLSEVCKTKFSLCKLTSSNT